MVKDKLIITTDSSSSNVSWCIHNHKKSQSKDNLKPYLNSLTSYLLYQFLHNNNHTSHVSHHLWLGSTSLINFDLPTNRQLTVDPSLKRPTKAPTDSDEPIKTTFPSSPVTHEEAAQTKPLTAFQ